MKVDQTKIPYFICMSRKVYYIYMEIRYVAWKIKRAEVKHADKWTPRHCVFSLRAGWDHYWKIMLCISVPSKITYPDHEIVYFPHSDSVTNLC